MIRRIRTVTVAVALLAALTGCSSAAASGTASGSGGPATSIRVGYFDNVTHAPALVGIHDGILQKALGKTKLEPQIFSAGPAEIEALSAGAIDAAYIGPSPAINSYLQSAGASLRIVSGAATGGAALVVRPGIKSAADLKGKTLASPQLGNTQDVALRAWLAKHNLKTSLSGGGDVTVTPMDNAQTLALFQKGQLDGAWLPEPWVSQLVLNAGASVLVDEATLWPDGRFPTTVLAVSTAFLQKHPATVKALIEGNANAVKAISTDSASAASAINAQLKADTGKPLADNVLARSLKHVSFSVDPDAEAFPKLLSNAVSVGIGKNGSLRGIFDLSLLNQVLTAQGDKPISNAGLGEKSK